VRADRSRRRLAIRVLAHEDAARFHAVAAADDGGLRATCVVGDIDLVGAARTILKIAVAVERLLLESTRQVIGGAGADVAGLPVDRGRAGFHVAGEEVEAGSPRRAVARGSAVAEVVFPQHGAAVAGPREDAGQSRLIG